MSFAIVPVWRITPGLAITTPIWPTPPITASRPRMRVSTSSLLTPFWNDTTAVPGRTSGFTASAAASVSHSFTAIITTSAGASVAGSSVATTSRRCRSPSALSTRSPCCADCRQMRAARDERDVVARRRQSRAEIAAEAAGPHDHDTHARD